MQIERPVRGPAGRHAELHELLTSQNGQWAPEVAALHAKELAFARGLKNLYARSDRGLPTVVERGLHSGQSWSSRHPILWMLLIGKISSRSSYRRMTSRAMIASNCRLADIQANVQQSRGLRSPVSSVVLGHSMTPRTVPWTTQLNLW